MRYNQVFYETKSDSATSLADNSSGIEWRGTITALNLKFPTSITRDWVAFSFYYRLADVEDASKVIFHSEAFRLATSLRNIIEGINDVASGSSNSIVKMGQLKKKVTSLSSFISFLDPARESVEDDGYLSAQPCDDDIGPSEYLPVVTPVESSG